MDYMYVDALVSFATTLALSVKSSKSIIVGSCELLRPKTMLEVNEVHTSRMNFDPLVAPFFIDHALYGKLLIDPKEAAKIMKVADETLGSEKD